MKVSWRSFICFLLFGVAVSLHTTTAHTEETDSPEIPREFPNVDQNYTFVDNSSIRENLVNRAVTDTEVSDLLEDDNLKIYSTVENYTTPVQHEEELGPKNEVEWIEDGDSTEDNRYEVQKNNTDVKVDVTNLENKKATSTSSTTEVNTETKIQEDFITDSPELSSTQKTFTEYNTHSTTNLQLKTAPVMETYQQGVALIDGSVAAIFIGVFLVVCILGYTTLILWRKSLETRYGSRQMLVDKDDFYDPDDMRHFSI